MRRAGSGERGAGSGRRGLALWSLAAVLSAADLAPLPQSGAGHQAVLEALSALRRGDRSLLDQLPRTLYEEPPALADSQDPALGRRWNEQLGLADAVPAEAVARAFDTGRLIDVLLLAPADPRAAAARAVLGLDAGSTVSVPALPEPRSGPLPAMPPARLVHGDGWLFGLAADGAVRWQRQLDRQARVVCGLDGALVAQSDGLAWIGLDGERRPLPPLPHFARPLATHGQVAWFHAGVQAWRLNLTTGAVQLLLLSETPLGPPLMRGDGAWWLTPTSLVTTIGATVHERLPHLLAVSQVALLQTHPQGGLIRDGSRWWLVAPRADAPAEAQAEAWLLAGQRERARALLRTVAEPADDLRLRITLTDAHTPQQQALLALTQGKRDFSGLAGNPLLTEAATDLALPWTAWPHQVTLEAWHATSVGTPTVTLASDGITVRLRCMWSATRWWQRQWPMRLLLDAPSRSWALVPGAVVVVDGAGHLIACDDRTGELLIAADLPFDFDPAQVTRAADGLNIGRPGGVVHLPFAPASEIEKTRPNP